MNKNLRPAAAAPAAAYEPVQKHKVTPSILGWLNYSFKGLIFVAQSPDRSISNYVFHQRNIWFHSAGAFINNFDSTESSQKFWWIYFIFTKGIVLLPSGKVIIYMNMGTTTTTTTNPNKSWKMCIFLDKYCIFLIIKQSHMLTAKSPQSYFRSWSKDIAIASHFYIIISKAQGFQK